MNTRQQAVVSRVPESHCLCWHRAVRARSVRARASHLLIAFLSKSFFGSIRPVVSDRLLIKLFVTPVPLTFLALFRSSRQCSFKFDWSDFFHYFIYRSQMWLSFPCRVRIQLCFAARKSASFSPRILFLFNIIILWKCTVCAFMHRKEFSTRQICPFDFESISNTKIPQTDNIIIFLGLVYL